MRRILAPALAAGSADQQAAVVARLCRGYREIEEEVLQLCHLYRRSGDFLAEPLLVAGPDGGEDEDLPERIGPYAILARLGEGGMGEVLLAERSDDVFQKRVAVKVLRRGLHGELAERFVAERQILAGLEHPNIARILDGGTLADGRPYLVMELVAGERIDRYCAQRGLTIDQRIRLSLKVCSALQVAHRRLVVHGDIKPANVLVTAGAEPKLIDFGVAVPLGRYRPHGLTPGYASPEQLADEALTPASDIFSLGVVLYELLVGRRPPPPQPPGAAAETTGGVRPKKGRARKAAAIAPGLSGDLREIVGRCLAYSPEDRYGSAQALESDLERYLRCEPVSVVPHTVRYVTAKALRRRPLASALLILTLPAVVATALLAASERREAGRRAALAARFAAEGRELLDLGRRAALLPPEDAPKARERIEERIRTVREELQDGGAEALGPASYALGCGALVTDHFEAARSAFETAAEEGFAPADLPFLLGRTLLMLYRGKLIEAEKIPGEEERRRRLAELASRYRQPALEQLTAVADTDAGQQGATAALVAYYEARYPDAIRLARAAFARSPWLYESKQLEGEASVMLAVEARSNGRFEEARALLRAAGDAYAAALTVGRSDAALWAGEGSRRAELFELEAQPGSSPSMSVEQVLAPCDMSLRIAPQLAGPLITRAYSLWRWSDQLVRRHQDPMGPVREAIAAGERALEIDPREARAYQYLGLAATVAARWYTMRGDDPRDWLRRGQEALQQAVALDPRGSRAHNDLANLYYARSKYLYALVPGADPDPDLAAAIASYTRAVALDPREAKYRANLGLAWTVRARYDAERGHSPEKAAARALEQYERACELDPKDFLSRSNRPQTLNDLAACRLAGGGEVKALLDAASREIGELLQQHPGWSLLENNRADNFRLQALWALARGADAGRLVSAGLAAARREQEHMPASAIAWVTEAQVHLVAVRQAMERRRSPEVPLQAAMSALAVAASKPEPEPDSEVWAEACLRQASWLERIGRDALPAVQTGLREAAKAVAARPRAVAPLALQAVLLLHLGTDDARRRGLEALGALERSGAIVPFAIRDLLPEAR